MDDWNAPIWDIVGSKNGFYTPDGCYSLTGKTEGDPVDKDCTKDCFTIDQYCLWDFGLKIDRNPRMAANPEGGARTYYEGLRYNSIFCNAFSMFTDGNVPKMLVKNENDMTAYCFTLNNGIKNVQLWSNAWNNLKEPTHCHDIYGKDWGKPKSCADQVTSPAPTTATPTAAAKKSCVYKPWMLYFVLCSSLQFVLMNAAVIVVAAAYFVGMPKVRMLPDEVRDEQ